mmetsp:Transcript_4257/g.12044  ORF Transcript_4257/g.12044 Transcript_4257/m.12044 type:complete len:217 (+) Transcript_4257:446-1096(+)
MVDSPGKALDSCSSSMILTSVWSMVTKLSGSWRYLVIIRRAVMNWCSSARRFTAGRRFKSCLLSLYVSEASMRISPVSFFVSCNTTMSTTRLILPSADLMSVLSPAVSSSEKSSRLLWVPWPHEVVSMLLFLRNSFNSSSSRPIGGATSAEKSVFAGFWKMICFAVHCDSVIQLKVLDLCWKVPFALAARRARTVASVTVTSPVRISLRYTVWMPG